MVIKLDGKELNEMIMEAVREVSQSEVFAGLIWHFCINSQDHFYKGEYYDLPVSFQMRTQRSGFRLVAVTCGEEKYSRFCKKIVYFAHKTDLPVFLNYTTCRAVSAPYPEKVKKTCLPG